MREALERVINESVNAVREGYNIVILSDKGVNNEYAYIPMLLVSFRASS